MRPAPEFSLQDQDDRTHTLADYAGKWLVVYFYPRDDTPVCTNEACSFRDAREFLAQAGNAVVVGISKDNVRSHRKFADRHQLNFTLLSDPEHTTIEAFGAWGPRRFMGREFDGIHRNTYLVNPEGMIVKEYESVDPTTHVKQILDDLKTLQANSSS